MAIREVYTAVVTNNRDPEKRARVKVKCQDLSAAYEYPLWIETSGPYAGSAANGAAFVFVPEVGTVVDLEMDHDPAGVLVHDGDGWPRPRYRGAQQYAAVPAAFGGDHYPRVAGFSLPDGSLFAFDADPAGAYVLLRQGPGGPQLLLNGKDGVAVLQMGADAVLTLDGTGKQATLDAGTAILLGAAAAEAAVLGTTKVTADAEVVAALLSLCTGLSALAAALQGEPLLIPTKAAAAALAPLVVSLLNATTAWGAGQAGYLSALVKVQ